MSHFEEVTRVWGELPYMDEKRGAFLRELITSEGCEDLLEIGFWKGKSSAYFAAILEDQGRGHLTTIDRKMARTREPNIDQVLGEVNLAHRVSPVFAYRSHTWVMARMLEKTPRPSFDFCYFDGGHTWDDTGFGLLLVSMLLRPGGILVVDDLNWTINKSISRDPKAAARYSAYSANEKGARPVMMAWDNIVPYLGYEDARMVPELHWGIARKPRLAESAAE